MDKLRQQEADRIKKLEEDRRRAEERAEQNRFREQVLSELGQYKESEDLERFFERGEQAFKRAGLAYKEWIIVMTGKLTGLAAAGWADIIEVEGDYEKARQRLLTTCGYTAKAAGVALFSTRFEDVRLLSADEIIVKGKMLFKRMLEQGKVNDEAVFSTVKWWVYNLMPKKVKIAIDNRNVTSLAELAGVLRDFMSVEGSLSPRPQEVSHLQSPYQQSNPTRRDK